MDKDRIKSIIESLIFVSESPLPFAKIRSILESVPAEEIKAVMAEMAEDYKKAERGFQLEEVAMGFQFRTRPENVEWVRMLVEKKPQKLSKASLETLAIIAYNQPATRPEVESIRGVDCSSAINLLLEKRLIKILGRKDAPGKPFIFGTTREFLELFNLKDLSQLPSLKEIENLEDDDTQKFTNPESETAGELPFEPRVAESAPDVDGDGVAEESIFDGESDESAPTDAGEIPEEDSEKPVPEDDPEVPVEEPETPDEEPEPPVDVPEVPGEEPEPPIDDVEEPDDKSEPPPDEGGDPID